MHMNLREFLCNSAHVNSLIAIQDRAINPSNASLLGIRWQFDRDDLLIPFKTSQLHATTKRTALRALASTYDPLGLLTPFLAPVKVFIQDLWKQNMGWDVPLEKPQLDQWLQLVANLQHPIPRIRRLVMPAAFTSNIVELCVFGDASQRLYACCAYLVCRLPTTVYSNLLMAKSHLNHPKPITVPRTELLAALISIRLAQYLINHLNLPISAIHVFSDSLIALHWIHTVKHYKVFVQNRVDAIRRTISEIEAQNITVKFHYVASENNPADCATRGLATKEAKNHIWWSGPHFLRSPQDQWPDAHIDFCVPPQGDDEVQSEYVEVQVAHSVEFKSVLPFPVTNSYFKLICITVYVLKFLRRRILERVSSSTRVKIMSKLPSVELISSSCTIQASDVDAAENLLILTHYRECEPLLKQMELTKFNAQRAQDQLIRCPSRIGPIERSPILLVPSHRLTYLIVFHHHYSSHHSGVYQVIASLRQRFFIPSIRKCVANVLRTCVTCKKINGHAYKYPDMPQLPPERTTRSCPFQNIGVDYLGPITIGNPHTVSNKVWICLITCMSTRAVHLEIVLDNSAQEFLLAFRRFVARRGTPSVIYSDNSTTFHAAENAITSVLFSSNSWTAISNYCVKHKITWKFITPLSPWKGGFYERLVALFKTAYKKSVGRVVLPLNQLQTVVVEIEATLNSRPITSFRERNAFAYVLRPIDFISPTVDIQLPPLPSQSDPIFEVSHHLAPWYKETLSILDQFWELWQSDYLSALQERQQTRIRQPKYSTATPQVGDIVIVADDKLAHGQWPYGLIEKLHIGKDKSIRSADVRMPSGNIKTRSLTHLYPLEIRAATSPLRNEDTPSAPASQRVQPSRVAKSAHKFISGK
ncbi:Retrotransposon domain containing protein [Trichostrongylus colubriformis]|uniref:Retrotransposon domain containing protein n=1 Tax=Trichostrongylus colubriformis TaxID=6319 RepID=A0AAN8FS39_TRICO